MRALGALFLVLGALFLVLGALFLVLGIRHFERRAMA